jgi:hypothetical protein
MLDLRIPTGLFFSAIGLILVAMGVFSPGTRSALSAVNVNLYAGSVMLLFGLVMLGLTRKRS